MPTTEMTCPKCGGNSMWDNRETKKNPAAPDYKCANKSCDGVIWPARKGTNGHAPSPAASTAKQPFTAGGRLPYEEQETGAPPEQDSVNPAAAKLASLFKLHALCADHAANLANHLDSTHGIHASAEAVSALTAQVFIAATNKGLAA